MATNTPALSSDNVRPVPSLGVLAAAEFNPSNCTIVAVVPRYVLDHPIAKLDNGDIVVLVPVVFPVGNRPDGRQDPSKFPDEALAGAHQRGDVADAFRAVGVQPFGAV